MKMSSIPVNNDDSSPPPRGAQPAPTPPVDNDHVAPGCELFQSMPAPKSWDYISPIPYRVVNETSVYSFVGDVPVADCANGQELHHERNKANADFIVRACNSNADYEAIIDKVSRYLTGDCRAGDLSELESIICYVEAIRAKHGLDRSTR